MPGRTRGEASNSLRRAVFFHRQGEFRDRTFENQIYRASGLSLLNRAAKVPPVSRSLRLAFRTWLTRRALTELTSRELADIGVSRTAAQAEASKWFWQA